MKCRHEVTYFGQRKPKSVYLLEGKTFQYSDTSDWRRKDFVDREYLWQVGVWRSKGHKWTLAPVLAYNPP